MTLQNKTSAVVAAVVHATVTSVCNVYDSSYDSGCRRHRLPLFTLFSVLPKDDAVHKNRSNLKVYFTFLLVRLINKFYIVVSHPQTG